MRHFSLLLLLLVFLITSCAMKTDVGESSNIELHNKKSTKEHTIIPKELPDDQNSIPIPIQTDPVDTNTKEHTESYEYYKLTPVDQAVEDKDLIEFREALLTNIKERNIDFLDKYFDEQGMWDFGGTTKEQLLESWNEESWLELQKAVLLGGAFFNEAKTVFIAPYIHTLFPDEFDAFEFEVATKDHVEVYIDKNVNSDLIEILDYTIVKRIYEEEHDSSWKKIQLPDKRVGYVTSDNIRSPVDYRVGFAKINNDWKIDFFLAGD